MTTIERQKLTTWVKTLASALGFYDVGFAKADFMEEEARRLEAWLSNSYHGEMSYLAKYFDLRVDPRKILPGAKTVICLSYNYYTEKGPVEIDSYKIAKYAYGRDYHKVVKKKLFELVRKMKEKIGDFNSRCFVDSGPVLERDWARRSGLGWIGKNTLLIHPRKGSFFFLAVIICDVELEYGSPMRDYCGTCRRCIDACPTAAISPEGYVLDGSKCISYLTIELRNSIPEEFKGKMENWIFGCDICQDVCPWNRFSKPHTEKDFEPGESLLSMTKKDWEELTEATFEKMFAGSAVKRAKYEGLKRNIAFANNLAI